MIILLAYLSAAMCDATAQIAVDKACVPDTIASICVSDTAYAAGEKEGIFPSLRWHDIKPMAARVATSVAISSLAKWAIVDVMKDKIHSMRPDRSDNSSMPSRHAAWAYGIATTASNYLVPYSPFWGLGAHVAASAVGFQRVIDHHHYPGDVLAGAGIGIGTSLLSDQVSRLIFRAPSDYRFPKKIESATSLSFSTGAAFPIEKRFGDLNLGSSLISELTFSTEVNDPWTVSGVLYMQTAPLKCEGYYLGVLTHIGAGAGGGYSCPLGDTPLVFSASASAGVRYAFAPKHIEVRRLSPYADVSVRLDLHLTGRFTVGAETGYTLSSLSIAHEGEPYRSRAVSSVKCALVTIAHF